MPTSKELLNWNLSHSVFKTNGQRLISPQTKVILNENINHLNNIAHKNISDSVIPKQELLEDIYNKFKSLENDSIEVLLESFTKREVRLLVWSLDYKEENSILYSAQFFKFISLVNQYWRDSFIIPIWYVLLKNWISLDRNKNRKNELIALLKKKCNQYDKSRKDVVAIKNHFHFWEPQGEEQYVEYLTSKGIHIGNVCKALNMNSNILGTTYYYMSYVKYLQDIHKGVISNEWIEEILVYIRNLNNTKYKLLLVSTLITNNKFYSQLANIQKTAFTHIGDPITKRYWTNAHLNEEEKKVVETARKKLMVLMNKDFIEFFFSELVEDLRREKYWLKFIDHIEDIKFVGNKLNYNILKNNQEISKYVDTRYKITTRNQKTCALIMYAKDYVFVEFSDIGSLYVYNLSQFQMLFKSLNTLDRLEELKRLPNNLIEIHNGSLFMPKNNGKLAHRGEWETRLDVWMRKYF